MPKHIFIQLVVIFCSTILLGLAIYILSIYKRIFPGIRNTWLRLNIVVICVALLIMAGLMALQTPEALANNQTRRNVLVKMASELGWATVIVFFVFNVSRLVSGIPSIKRLSFIKYHTVIILTIVISSLFIYSAVNYVGHDYQFTDLHATLVFAYYNALLTGFIYTAVSYVNLERKRKLDEKELEVARLQAMKTKAELEALHSKINPHFLYNALNSIADLSVTDGKKGRKMTIALADLFRYSINYSNHNYSTVKDELAMAEVYLQIEKIRFEDNLNYSIHASDETLHYLVPRFLLQPVVENAVKHGLKATGKMTEIDIRIIKEGEGLLIEVADNGPAFPEDLVPGYGVKSVFDKLDLLFPDKYTIQFSNKPGKKVVIHINKLIKDEPVI